MAAQAPGQRPGHRNGSGRAALLVAALALSLAACSPQVRHHGYAPQDAQLAEIEVGRATRDEVAARIGRPGTTGMMTDDAWFYVGSRWEQRAPRPAAEVSRDVVAISFDGRGVVRNIERFGLQDGQPVALSRRVTDTTVRGQGLLAQLLRNVGRFSTDQIID